MQNSTQKGPPRPGTGPNTFSPRGNRANRFTTVAKISLEHVECL